MDRSTGSAEAGRLVQGSPGIADVFEGVEGADQIEGFAFEGEPVADVAKDQLGPAPAPMAPVLQVNQGHMMAEAFQQGGEHPVPAADL